MDNKPVIIKDNDVLMERETLKVINYMKDPLKPLLETECAQRLVFLQAFTHDTKLAKMEYRKWMQTAFDLYIQIVKWMNDPGLQRDEFLYLHSKLYDFLETLPDKERDTLIKMHTPRPRRFKRRETI